MSYILTREEIETDITIDYIDKRAYVFTNYAPTRQRLLMLADERPDEIKIEKNVESGLHVLIPLNWIKISPPRKRNMTDEEKAQLVERFKAGKENKILEKEDA